MCVKCKCSLSNEEHYYQRKSDFYCGNCIITTIEIGQPEDSLPSPRQSPRPSISTPRDSYSPRSPTSAEAPRRHSLAPTAPEAAFPPHRRSSLAPEGIIYYLLFIIYYLLFFIFICFVL